MAIFGAIFRSVPYIRLYSSYILSNSKNWMCLSGGFSKASHIYIIITLLYVLLIECDFIYPNVH